jgi:hypothetical protein
MAQKPFFYAQDCPFISARTAISFSSASASCISCKLIFSSAARMPPADALRARRTQNLALWRKQPGAFPAKGQEGQPSASQNFMAAC